MSHSPVASKPLFFSVIIASYNRQCDLEELLESLEDQSIPQDEYEVLVVDDGSTDGTVEFCRCFQARTKMQFRVYQQSHQGPGAARNCGMEQARGDVLVFTDSDCVAPPDWLATVKQAFDQQPTIGAFGGRDDAYEGGTPFQQAVNYSMTSFLSTGGLRGSRQHRLARFYPRSFNMGLRREVAERIGGFSTLRHGQDIELSHRILQSSTKVAHLPEVVVYHKRRSSLRGFFRQVFNWGVARIDLWSMESGMLEPLHTVPAIAIWLGVAVATMTILAPWARSYGPVMMATVVSILLMSGIHAAAKSRSWRVGTWTPVAIVCQVLGYGLGFTWAFFRRITLRKGV